MADTGQIRVSVLFSPVGREVREWSLRLSDRATVLEALQASGLPTDYAELDLRSAPVGVWGRKARLSQPLRDGDRVEVYRPLTVDPKVARRERFRKQGARAAGLFAKKREGAKPGY
jgi:putative ubiquitin-RnfH superfamily antitoxin RatB of RatAB toxin-antitoxin module